MNILKILKNIMNIILDIIFPPSKIQKKLKNITAEDFIFEVNRTTYEDKNVITIFDYNNKLIKQAIWSLKFRNNKRLSKIFAQIIYDEILEKLSDLKIFSNFKDPVLIPIPLFKKRLRERGYNQCELIAEEMSVLDKNSNFILEKNVLIKIKDTTQQSRAKNKKERLENLKGCFKIKKFEKIKSRNIILLDDVITTGATIKEARNELKKNGARKIITITIAH